MLLILERTSISMVKTLMCPIRTQTDVDNNPLTNNCVFSVYNELLTRTANGWLDEWLQQPSEDNHILHPYQGGWEPESQTKQKPQLLRSCRPWKYVLPFCVGEFASPVSLMSYSTGQIWHLTRHRQHLKSTSSETGAPFTSSVQLSNSYQNRMHVFQSILIVIVNVIFATVFSIFFSKLSHSIFLIDTIDLQTHTNRIQHYYCNVTFSASCHCYIYGFQQSTSGHLKWYLLMQK